MQRISPCRLLCFLVGSHVAILIKSSPPLTLFSTSGRSLQFVGFIAVSPRICSVTVCSYYQPNGVQCMHFPSLPSHKRVLSTSRKFCTFVNYKKYPYTYLSLVCVITLQVHRLKSIYFLIFFFIIVNVINIKSTVLVQSQFATFVLSHLHLLSHLQHSG